MSATTLTPSRGRLSRLFVAFFVLVLGGVVAVPQIAYVWRQQAALAGTTAQATWIESRDVRSGGEAPMLPTYGYQWSFGGAAPVSCRVDLPRFRHGRNTVPREKTLTVVAHRDCDAVEIVDTRTRERYPMVVLGLAVMAAGFGLTILAARRPATGAVS
jgi:hypothetical protein